MVLEAKSWGLNPGGLQGEADKTREFGKLDFEKPWTTTMEDMNLRQAINRIAEHLCATCGWQLSGTTDIPTIMFYRRLQAATGIRRASGKCVIVDWRPLIAASRGSGV